MLLASVALAETVIDQEVNFLVVAFIIAILFATLGFGHGPGKAVLHSAGLFLAYGAAVKTADFIRQGLNFTLGLKWDASTAPVIRFTIFLVAFLIMYLFVWRIVKFSDRFGPKLMGGAIGFMNGLVFSTFMLEFMARYWEKHPPDLKVKLDLTWLLRLNPSWKGALKLNLYFNNNPVPVYNMLNTMLKFLVFAILILALPPVFLGLRKTVSAILRPALNLLGLSE